MGYRVGLLVFLAVVLAPRTSLADFWALDEVSINYKKFDPSARHPLFYDSTPKESLNLNLNADLLKAIGTDFTVQSMTNQSQYYVVALQARLYLRVTKYLEIGYFHESTHLLDHTYPYPFPGSDKHFPVLDAWTVNLYLYRAHSRGSIF